ncbi:uncharacterized protein MELLADRAFT_117953, partial [Melampsora larici-populina 98AG31]
MDSISSFTKTNDHMDLRSSNTIASRIDSHQTSHPTDTPLHDYDRPAQLTSNSSHDHHGITSKLSSLTLSDELAPIQQDQPVDRISKYTPLREQKLNATLPTRFDSSSVTQSSTSKTAAPSSPHRIDSGSVKPDQKPLEIDAGHVHAMPDDNRSPQDAINLGTHMRSDEGRDHHSSMLHQVKQGSIGLLQRPSRGRSDKESGNWRSGGSVEQSRNLASTSTNLGNRRQNGT